MLNLQTKWQCSAQKALNQSGYQEEECTQSSLKASNVCQEYQGTAMMKST